MQEATPASMGVGFWPSRTQCTGLGFKVPYSSYYTEATPLEIRNSFCRFRLRSGSSMYDRFWNW